MAVRLGYRETDVGVLPLDWAVVPLGELLEFRNGVNAEKAAYGSGIRFINVLEVITKSHLRANDIPGRISLPKSASDSYRVRRGDILFNRTSETQEEVGLAAVYADDEEVVFGGFVIRGRPTAHADLDDTYCGYGLRAPQIRRQIVARGQGAIRANVGQQDLKTVLVPRPPRHEQEAIATALTDVDALLSALDRLITKKSDIKQAAMQQLLTGQTRLPGFSGNWERARLETVCAFITKGSTPTTYGYDWEKDGILFLRSECVSEAGLDLGQSMFISEAAHSVLRRSESRNGDVLMTITGNVGRVVYLDGVVGGANINQHIARIRVLPTKANARFIYHLLAQPVMRQHYGSITTGQAYPQISLRQVRDTVVATPPIEEQAAIAAVLSDLDGELTLLKQRRHKALFLKQGMMQELFTGRTRLV